MLAQALPAFNDGRVKVFSGAVWLWLLLVLMAAGCALAPIPPAQTTSTGLAGPSNTYHHVPEIHISTWEKFNPLFWLGNADDPRPPASYRPGQKLRVFRWYVRNPFHNFMFYVIGISDKEFVRAGTFPRKTMNPEGGWAWAICRYKCVRLPCVSYGRNGFDFYFGWRNRGNFGIAVRWKLSNRPADFDPTRVGAERQTPNVRSGQWGRENSKRQTSNSKLQIGNPANT